jgi:hypothetical protein
MGGWKRRRYLPLVLLDMRISLKVLASVTRIRRRRVDDHKDMDTAGLGQVHFLFILNTPPQLRGDIQGRETFKGLHYLDGAAFLQPKDGVRIS